ERRKVVRQLLEARRQQAGVLDLRLEELNRVRQPRRGEDFLIDALEHLLRRQVLRDALAQGAEEIHLLDVLFTVEELAGIHAVILSQPIAWLQRSLPILVPMLSGNQDLDVLSLG